jgi:hypothetical protein
MTMSKSKTTKAKTSTKTRKAPAVAPLMLAEKVEPAAEARTRTVLSVIDDIGQIQWKADALINSLIVLNDELEAQMPEQALLLPLRDLIMDWKRECGVLEGFLKSEGAFGKPVNLSR